MKPQRRPERPSRDSWKQVPLKKKFCHLCQNKVGYIDYKDLRLLRNFISEKGKILSRRVRGTCARHQRKLSVAIKRARYIGFLPFMAG